MSGGKPKHLWLSRNRLGLKQKQIARLLGDKDNNQVSRYENGADRPTLERALKLEIIFGSPLRLLFAELYEQALSEVVECLKLDPTSYGSLSAIGNADFCSFAKLLESPNLSEEEFDRIRNHAIYLHNRFGERLSETGNRPSH